MHEVKHKDILFSKNSGLNLKGNLINFEIPKVVGILNVTTNSFFDGGLYTTKRRIKRRIDSMLEDGADFIDVGGYSSRPGATEISEKDELKALLPALEIMSRDYPDVHYSVDTFRSGIAKVAVRDYGASIINDITAFTADKEMPDIISGYRLPYIIMHMQGTPYTMQKNPVYSDVVNDIIKFFAEKIHYLRSIGITDYIIDPGFGFGKTIDHNYTLLKELDSFRIFECPLMVGLSRKSMIYKFLNIDINKSLNGTTALHMLALINGANLLRVHDVKEAVETIKLYKKMF